ncbi:hypothetical protein [Arthrobacter sp. HLT1-21]
MHGNFGFLDEFNRILGFRGRQSKARLCKGVLTISGIVHIVRDGEMSALRGEIGETKD